MAPHSRVGLRAENSGLGLRQLWKVVLALLLVSTSIIAISAVSAIPAAALGDSTCPNQTNSGVGNFSSTACLYGVVENASYTEFHNNTMTFLGSYGLSLETSMGWHINHTLWAYSGSPCNEWMEIGDTQGNGPGTPAIYKAGYYYYWGMDVPGFGYHGYIIGNSNNNGTNHSYELLNDENGYYSAYLDGSWVGTAGILGHGTCIAQAGEELSGNDYGYGNYLAFQHSDSFENFPLDWLDTSNTWHLGWNTNQYWYDHPCNIGYTAPNCLDLSIPYSYQLFTDKP